jgi:proton-dependent oligopeptide transporter, POT family
MTPQAAATTLTAPARGGEFLGHPKGLSFLFATEMWERFSYYGMSALLVLYMVRYLFQPDHVEHVLGYAAIKSALELLFGTLDAQPLASQIFGFYTGLVYLTPIFGGLLADRVLGQRRTVILGALLMAVGHFMMAVESLFFVALLVLILGNGAFKPNISTQVGALYPPGDPRRDRAFSIFYVGINLGAFLAPLVCGTLGETYGWHYGFMTAGFGMLVSLATYLYGSRTLARDERRKNEARTPSVQLSRTEWRAVIGLLIVSGLVTFFWATYDQQSNTMVLWAEEFTDRSVDLFGWKAEIPTTWFLALNPLLIFAFTPLIVSLWGWQAARGREPSTVTKMVLGFAGVAGAYSIMVLAAWNSEAGHKASWLWFVAYVVILTIGELYLSPIGLALVSKLSPPKILSMMMGVWLATSFPGDILAGWLGGFWSSMSKPNFFLMIAGIAAGAGAAFWAASSMLRPLLRE